MDNVFNQRNSMKCLYTYFRNIAINVNYLMNYYQRDTYVAFSILPLSSLLTLRMCELAICLDILHIDLLTLRPQIA